MARRSFGDPFFLVFVGGFCGFDDREGFPFLVFRLSDRPLELFVF
jgi:hypothetical protein